MERSRTTARSFPPVCVEAGRRGEISVEVLLASAPASAVEHNSQYWRLSTAVAWYKLNKDPWEVLFACFRVEEVSYLLENSYKKCPLTEASWEKDCGHCSQKIVTLTLLPYNFEIVSLSFGKQSPYPTTACLERQSSCLPKSCLLLKRMGHTDQLQRSLFPRRSLRTMT